MCLLFCFVIFWMLCCVMCHASGREMRRGLKCRRMVGLLIIKRNKNEQKPPRGGKTDRQAGRELQYVQTSHTHDVKQQISTGLETPGE